MYPVYNSDLFLVISAIYSDSFAFKLFKIMLTEITEYNIVCAGNGKVEH